MEERKEKFTPGPWYIKPREVIRSQWGGDAYTRTTILDTPDGQYSPRHVIATVARGNGREEANAALIAAAPLLLLNLDAAIGQQPPEDEPVVQENPVVAESDEEEEDPKEIMDVDSVIDFTEIPRLEDAESETGSSISQEVTSRRREEE